MNAEASGAAPVHLIPVDEDWMAWLKQIEEPLLFQLTDDGQDDASFTWQLPEVFRGEVARDAWWRIYQAVRDAFSVAERHRLLAADGQFELAPLALVEIPDADLQVLIKVAYECNRAQAGLGSGQLAELLADLDVPGPAPLGSPNENPVQALMKVANSLSLPLDGDGQKLAEVIRDRGGADIVLTSREQDAYRRYMRRWVARMGGGGLELFSYGADR